MPDTLNWNSKQLTRGWQKGVTSFYWGLGFDETDLDKAWQGIHYCLNQTEYEAEPPLNFITTGGVEAGKIDIGYGPARLFKSEEVHNIVKSRLTSHKKKSFTNLLILGGFSVGRAPIKVSFCLIFTWIAIFLTTLDISAIPDFNISEIFTGLDFKQSKEN